MIVFKKNSAGSGENGFTTEIRQNFATHQIINKTILTWILICERTKTGGNETLKDRHRRMLVVVEVEMKSWPAIDGETIWRLLSSLEHTTGSTLVTATTSILCYQLFLSHVDQSRLVPRPGLQPRLSSRWPYYPAQSSWTYWFSNDVDQSQRSVIVWQVG